MVRYYQITFGDDNMEKPYKKFFAAAVFGAALCLSACSGQAADISETAAAQTEETSSALTDPETTETDSEAAETTAETTAITTETSAETTEETEPEPTFASDEAENFYSIIMNDLSWRRDEVVGATILDVHGDGIPEFLAVYEDAENDRDMVDCYSFGDEKLEFMYSFEPFRGREMTKYVDNGVTKWWGVELEYERYDESNEEKILNYSYRSENTYGFYEFTENGPVMTEKLFYEISEYDSETDIYKGEMYTNGELYGTDYIEEYTHLQNAPDMTYYSWFVAKADWEFEHFTDDENYELAPNNPYISGPRTSIKEDVSILRLVNAYCLDDKEYLTCHGRFGEVNAFKPVIYLYPTETADISVRLRLDGALTCSYPDYGTGWQVTARPDGTLYDKRDGNEYSYLYWEGALGAEWDMTKGFVVKGSDTAEFLREKLSYMGLTPREYNEFIVYWLPLMQNNKYNFITFQTEAYTSAAQLEVFPAPDSMLRVFMVYRPLDEPVETEEQELPTFERKGFAVVEWGGAEY